MYGTEKIVGSFLFIMDSFIYVPHSVIRCWSYKDVVGPLEQAELRSENITYLRGSAQVHIGMLDLPP